MAVYFLDSSAIVKRYVNEDGSIWVQGLVAPTAGNDIVVCELTPVEVFSIFERQRRNRALRKAKVPVLRSAFLAHYETEYVSIIVNNDIFMRARELVTTYKLWALDAVQLACAMRLRETIEEPVTFVSADDDQLTAAKGEGFPTDNPLLHR